MDGVGLAGSRLTTTVITISGRADVHGSSDRRRSCSTGVTRSLTRRIPALAHRPRVSGEPPTTVHFQRTRRKLSTGARPALITTQPWYTGPRAAEIAAAARTAVAQVAAAGSAC